MLKIIKKYLITALTILCAQTGQAHIFNIQKLVKGSHTIVLLSDFHSKLNAQQERNSIVNCVKACGGALVVEDSSICLGHDVKKKTDGTLYQWPLYAAQFSHFQETCPCPTTIFMLYSAAVNAGVAASNVEFRFDNRLTQKELFKMMQDKKTTFLNLCETSAYKQYYRDCLEYLKVNIEEPCATVFKQLAMLPQPIEMALNNNSIKATDIDIAQANKVKKDRNFNVVIKDGNDAIESLYNDYSNFLLEMEMMHAIEQYDNYKTVFVCAGAAHNVQIAQALIQHGYRLTHEAGHSIPEIVDPSNYDFMAQKTIDLEQALNTICKEESHANILENIVAQIGSILGLIKTFATSLFA